MHNDVKISEMHKASLNSSVKKLFFTCLLNLKQYYCNIVVKIHGIIYEPSLNIELQALALIPIEKDISIRKLYKSLVEQSGDRKCVV